MKDHLRELAERRLLLQARAATQRLDLRVHLGAIAARTSSVDRGIENARRLLRTPVLVAGGAALLVLLGPRRSLRVAGRAIMMFISARRMLRPLLHDRGDISPL